MRQKWIQDLIDKVDIEDLFRRDGHIITNSGKVNCPFHIDRNPSCQIYDDGFYCFGCGKGGSAIDYVMLKEGVSFWEAFKTLCAMYNHPLPNVSSAKAKLAQQEKVEADKVFSMLKDAFFEFNANLTSTDRQYLHSRGLNDETIDHELIGYAGSGGTLANLVKKYPQNELQKTGLFFVSKNGSLTEFYQRRFVFPYWRNGQIVYSIGRLSTDVKTQIAHLPDWNQGKYIKQLTHSKKHPYVSKCVKNLIWNADVARRFQTGVIAEGIIDGLLFKQEMTPRYDIGVISPLTTQFRKQDISRIAEICKHWKTVYLIPDAEESSEGMKGAIKTAEQLYDLGITSVRIVEIPKE
ncbi:MAG: CHC2 zinc finger domain-containing protein, partial [Candidatus Poribacteria bacterium]